MKPENCKIGERYAVRRNGKTIYCGNYLGTDKIGDAVIDDGATKHYTRHEQLRRLVPKKKADVLWEGEVEWLWSIAAGLGYPAPIELGFNLADFLHKKTRITIYKPKE